MGKVNTVLRDLKIGCLARVNRKIVKAVGSVRGCDECAFRIEEGAMYCKYTDACFANNRPDKKSVVFVEVSI